MDAIVALTRLSGKKIKRQAYQRRLDELHSYNKVLKKIADQEAEIAGKDAEIVGLGAEIAGKDAEIVGLGAEIAGKDAEIAGKDAEIAGKDAEIARLRAQLEDMNS